MKTDTRKRIAILCSDDAHHDYLVKFLASRFNVVAVVVEPARSQRQRLWRSRRLTDFAYALYHHARRSVFGLNAYRRGYFADPPVRASGDHKTLTVDWINDAKTVDLLTTTRPDLTVVICTSILKSCVLDVAGPMIVNVHGGFLPYYRGNHCFFFPFYRGEFDKIGSTLHFVDSGIDTGAIIENVIPSVHRNDSPETLYCRAEKMAIHRLSEWISHWERGGVIPRHPHQAKFPLHRTRDRGPCHDIHLWTRRITGKLSVPERVAVVPQPLQDEVLQRP